MAKRRRPFRRQPDGPTRQTKPSSSPVADSEESNDGVDPTADSRQLDPSISTRERQTAEHEFDAGALEPPPYPTSFSKAANVPINPLAFAQLHTASPPRPEVPRSADSDPLIEALRGGDDASAYVDDLDDESWSWAVDDADHDTPDELFEDRVDENYDEQDRLFEETVHEYSVSADLPEPVDAPVLTLDQPEPNWDLSRAGDAAAQVDFLRSEIGRYQSDLERERVARTTAITAAQLDADSRVEEIVRSHRHEREQLELINRQLLDAQRSEAEARRSALIEEHRRQRANEHTQYQQRIAELRASSRQIEQVTNERLETEYAAAHETQLAALAAKLDEATRDAERLETENRELLANQLEREARLDEAESDLAKAKNDQRESNAQLTRQVQELHERLARTEQRLAAERKRTSELVSNLLRESAQVASQARSADQEISSLRSSWADERDAVVSAALSEARAIERAAAEREAHLEATIGQLRAALHGTDSSTSGS